jgi:SepF-like predicted cell division protein (DUF552 family)
VKKIKKDLDLNLLYRCSKMIFDFLKRKNPEVSRIPHLKLVDADSSREHRFRIATKTLKSLGDVGAIIREYKKDNIVLINIPEDSEPIELKNFIYKLKSVCAENEGNLVGLDSNWLIMYPQCVVIEK